MYHLTDSDNQREMQNELYKSDYTIFNISVLFLYFVIIQILHSNFDMVNILKAPMNNFCPLNIVSMIDIILALSCVSVCVYRYMTRPKVDYQCLPLSVSALFFETWFFTCLIRNS